MQSGTSIETELRVLKSSPVGFFCVALANKATQGGVSWWALIATLTLSYRLLFCRFGHATASDAGSSRIGPGQYEIPGMAASLKKKITKSKEDGPFGSSSKRFQRFSSFDTPGPGQYTRKKAGRSGGSRVEQKMQEFSDNAAVPSSTTAAAAHHIERRSLSMRQLRHGAKGPTPDGSGTLRGTYVRRATTPETLDQLNRPSASFMGPPRDPVDYNRMDPNTKAAAVARQQPHRDPAAVRRKRAEAGGGSIGHGITNEACSAAAAQQAAIAVSRAAGGKAGHAAVRLAEKAPSRVGPTASTYDTSHNSHWTTRTGPDVSRGGERFREAKQETMAGPGSYNLPSTIQPARKHHSQRGIMGSQELRMPSHKPTTDVPGPGAYDVALNYGNLLKPTFNVAIAEAAADVGW